MLTYSRVQTLVDSPMAVTASVRHVYPCEPRSRDGRGEFCGVDFAVCHLLAGREGPTRADRDEARALQKP